MQHHLESLVQILVADLNRLHERLQRVEHDHATKLSQLASTIDLLAANVQGGGGFEEEDDDEQHHPPPPSQQSLTPKHRARKRWHWAYAKIRLRRIPSRVPIDKAKLGPRNSMAVRLRRVEEKLDNAHYHISVLVREAGPDHVRAAMERAEKVEADSRDCSVRFRAETRIVATKLTAVEVDVDTLKIKTKEIDRRTEDHAVELQSLSTRIEGVAETATAAADLVSSRLAGNTAATNDINLVRRRLPPLLATLADVVSNQASSKDLRRGGRKKNNFVLKNRLEAVRAHLAAARLDVLADSTGAAPDDWHEAVEETARFLHATILDDDDDDDDALSLGNVIVAFPTPDDLRRDFTNITEDDVEALAALGTACSTVRDLVEVCRRVLAEALLVDDEKNRRGRRLGMLALDAWYASPAGPGGRRTVTRFDACDAGIVAAQAALGLSAGTQLNLTARVRDLERANKNDDLRAAAASSSDAAAKAANQAIEDLQAFRAALNHTNNTIDELRQDLRAKAGQHDTAATLGVLRTEILRLATTAVGTHQLQAGLKTKLDRKDINRIAALVANGNLPGINPAVAAKLQIPDFRCLSCDRPLPSQALALSAMVRHCAADTLDRPTTAPTVSIPEDEEEEQDAAAAARRTHRSCRATKSPCDKHDDPADDDVYHSKSTFSKYHRIMPAQTTPLRAASAGSSAPSRHLHPAAPFFFDAS